MSIFFGTGAANTWQGGSDFIRQSGISGDSDVSTVLPHSRRNSLQKKSFISEGYLFFCCHKGFCNDRA